MSPRSSSSSRASSISLWVHGDPRALLLRASVSTVGLGAFIAKQDVSVVKTSHMD